MHIHNPVSGEKRGYGFVDFVDESSTKKALGAAQHNHNRSGVYILLTNSTTMYY